MSVDGLMAQIQKGLLPRLLNSVRGDQRQLSDVNTIQETDNPCEPDRCLGMPRDKRKRENRDTKEIGDGANPKGWHESGLIAVRERPIGHQNS